MLNDYTATFCEWFGDDTFLCMKIVFITEFLLENELEFIEIQEQDDTYCAKFLYMIDQGIKKYAESARWGIL